MELGNSGGRRPWRQQVREVKNTPGEIAVVVVAIGILAAAGYTGLTQTRFQDKIGTQSEVNEVTSSERNTKVVQTPGPTSTNLGDIGITQEPKPENGQGGAAEGQGNSGTSNDSRRNVGNSDTGSRTERRQPGRPAVPGPVDPGSGSDPVAPVVQPTDPAPDPDPEPESPTPTFEPTSDVTVVPNPTDTDDSSDEPDPVDPADPGPVKPDPEPEKPGPIKPDPVKPDPVDPGPVKPDPEPEKPGPIKPDPVKPGPVKPEPEKPAPVKPGPAKPEPDPVPGPGVDTPEPQDPPAVPRSDAHAVGSTGPTPGQ